MWLSQSCINCLSNEQRCHESRATGHHLPNGLHILSLSYPSTKNNFPPRFKRIPHPIQNPQRKMMPPLSLKLINHLKNHSFPMLMQRWHCVSRLAVVKSMRILLRSTSSELPTEQPQLFSTLPTPSKRNTFRKAES